MRIYNKELNKKLYFLLKNKSNFMDFVFAFVEESYLYIGKYLNFTNKFYNIFWNKVTEEILYKNNNIVIKFFMEILLLKLLII